MGRGQEKKVFDIRKDADIAELTKIANFKYKPATLSGKAPVLIAITSKLAHIPLAYGAYAAEKIKKDSQFEYTGTELPTSKVTDKTYAYAVSGKKKMIDGLNEGNELRAINHSALFYNMIPVLTPDGSAIMYMAIRDIKPGEQLLVPYGDDYDYPEDLIILHPSDSYHFVEELIKKHYQSKPHHVDIKIDGGLVYGDFYLTDAAEEMINKPGKFFTCGSKYTTAELDLPLLRMSGGECDPLHLQHGLTPLMLMAAQGKDTIVELLIAKGVEINRVDYENNTALTYSLAHNQPRCAEKLLKALDRKIEHALRGSDEDKDQQKQSLILQSRAENTLLQVAVLINADVLIVQKILRLYNKLEIDPFMYTNKKGMCPLLTAISLGNLILVSELTRYIYESGYTHYHESQKNADENKKSALTAYGEAFSKLSVNNIKSVIEKLVEFTNVFTKPKFVLNLFDAWLNAELINQPQQFTLRFQVIADEFRKIGVDEKTVNEFAAKYLAPIVAKMTAHLHSRIESFEAAGPAPTEVDFTPQPQMQIEPPIPDAPKATRLLMAAATVPEDEFIKAKERMAGKRKAEATASTSTVAIAPVQLAKRITRFDSREGLPVSQAEPMPRKRKAEAVRSPIAISAIDTAAAADDIVPVQRPKRVACSTMQLRQRRSARFFKSATAPAVAPKEQPSDSSFNLM